MFEKIGVCMPIIMQQEEGMESLLPFIILIALLFVVFYFFMIRPQRQRQKEFRKMMEELRRGDRVITAGGIFGIVDEIMEDSVVLKLEDGETRMRVLKQSIVRKI